MILYMRKYIESANALMLFAYFLLKISSIAMPNTDAPQHMVITACDVLVSYEVARHGKKSPIHILGRVVIVHKVYTISTLTDKGRIRDNEVHVKQSVQNVNRRD